MAVYILVEYFDSDQPSNRITWGAVCAAPDFYQRLPNWRASCLAGFTVVPGTGLNSNTCSLRRYLEARARAVGSWIGGSLDNAIRPNRNHPGMTHLVLVGIDNLDIVSGATKLFHELAVEPAFQFEIY